VIVSIIVAIDERRAIGLRGAIPWRLPADLKKFKDLTWGHHILMGRKTFESIGKPLPGRHTVIITRDRSYRAEGCLVAHSLKEALSIARERGETEAFVCGGAEVYKEALALADRIYLTEVRARVEADTFFPEWERDDWVAVESTAHDADEKNQYAFSFTRLVRRDFDR
jgi:dihydrofolate reductase